METGHAETNHRDDQENPSGQHWRAPETPLGQLLICAEAIERGNRCANDEEWCRVESQSLVCWAQERDLLLTIEEFQSLTPPSETLLGGVEHQVWVGQELEGVRRVFKATRPPFFGSRARLGEYVRNALWSNALFEDDIRLHAVYGCAEGVFLLVSQPFVLGTSPTESEIEVWFQRQGYIKNGFRQWKHPQNGIRIADAHPGNLIRTKSGFLVPIDLQVLSIGSA